MAVGAMVMAQAPNLNSADQVSGVPVQNESLKSVKLHPNPSARIFVGQIWNPIAKHVKLNVHNIIGSEMPLEAEVIDDFELHIKVKDFSRCLSTFH